MKADIVIIDSGVNTNHPLLLDEYIVGIEISENLAVSSGIADSIGHGTAVYYLMRKYAPKANIIVVKIFDATLDTDLARLIFALEYVLENIECKIVHLSNGVTYCDNISQLNHICSMFIERGIILVAAFDNSGVLSYPACFDTVIGVDTSENCKKITEYIYIENSPINFRGVGTSLRLPWLNQEYKLVGGSSFAAPYITAKIYDLILNGHSGLSNILLELKRNANQTICCEQSEPLPQPFAIGSAIVFPFNKEMHSVVRYRKLLNFELQGVYDVKYLGNVSKKLSDLLNICEDGILKNYEQIDWDGAFDTIILGHTIELGKAIGTNFITYMLNKCIQHKKNIFCFDDLSGYKDLCDIIQSIGLHCYYPFATGYHVKNNTFNKLNHIGKPIIGIFGTSPKQGKFSLQLEMRERFMNRGYRVGQVGTEPTAPLFGFDTCIPTGYASTSQVHDYQLVTLTNSELARIEQTNPDIILIGGQSHLVPLTTGNLGHYNLDNTSLILGSEPDVFVLCVNYNDDIKYIRRNFLFLEGIIDTKVIAIVIFPFRREILWDKFGNITEKLNESKLMCKKNELMKEFSIPAYVLTNPEELDSLVETCVNYFE
ncbi:MAG: DUF1611 domain-containing protein [Clostridium sp.]|jgi:hypothetical protein|nr:DUF1611 domain-containing protein [Clostridium sp.]